MVTTDGSAGASCTVDVAAALAKGLDAKLIVATVAETPRDMRCGNWHGPRKISPMYSKRQWRDREHAPAEPASISRADS